MGLDELDGGINTGRMIVAGIVAGVVIDAGELVANAFLFADDLAAMAERANIPVPAGMTIVLFNVLGIALGIGTVWMYAAIRPRFGPGPRTGVCAGLAVWGFFYLLPGITQNLLGLYPLAVFVKAVIFQAVFMAAAGYIGGMLYKED